MLNRVVFVVSLVVTLAASVSANERGTLLDAMTAELQRNQKTLQIDDFEVPYFIGYRIIEQRKVDARATFGALIREQDVRQRRAAVDVRVGDYRFDSSLPNLAMG